MEIKQDRFYGCEHCDGMHDESECPSQREKTLTQKLEENEHKTQFIVTCECGEETLLWIQPSKFREVAKKQLSSGGYLISHEDHKEEYLMPLNKEIV